jgi:putative transposase
MAEYRHSGAGGVRYQVSPGVDRQIPLQDSTRGSGGARDLIRQICHAREVVIVRGSVSPDHIHVLVSGPAHLAPSKLVQYIKGRLSGRLQEEFPSLRKRYWGQHLRARCYFCATVGAVDEETIRAYIENQNWDEDEQGFKIAAPTEPWAEL